MYCLRIDSFAFILEDVVPLTNTRILYLFAVIQYPYLDVNAQ